MPRKCDTCKHFRILYGDRCSNREIAQIANRTIDTRLDTARDICDRESNGIFIYFEPKEPRAGAAFEAGMKCPRCDSPKPNLHPAMQFEGEVSPCSDPFHALLQHHELRQITREPEALKAAA